MRNDQDRNPPLPRLGKGPYVLDTSAFMSGQEFAGFERLFTTPGVLDEMKKGRLAKMVENLLEINLKVQAPSDEFVKKVTSRAVTSGSALRLSGADISVIALSLELGHELLSDDYTILNTCREAGVRARPVLRAGIKNTIEFQLRCQGCGRWFDSPPEEAKPAQRPGDRTDEKKAKKKIIECPVCGSALKAKVKRQ
jgi:rRNA maturation endonuclease Nob1